MSKPLVSVVLPAYNEEAGLRSSLDRVWTALEALQAEYRTEIVVVDDGSTDRTGQVAESFAGEHDGVRVLRHWENLRLGQALRSAFQASRGDIIVVLDADLSYTPEIIGALLKRMHETRARIVIASPYRKGGKVLNVPLFRKIMSRWANRFLCRMATKDRFSDRLTNITGMVRAYDGEFIRGLCLWAMDVDINSEIINKAKILRARIVEIPAVLDWGPAKPGVRRRGKRGRDTLRSIIQSLVSGFLFRPFMFFIGPGLGLLILSLYPLFWTFLHTLQAYGSATPGASFDFRLSEAIGAAFKLAPHAFIVGGISLLVAVQLISLGLLALQKKRYFVELFTLGTLILRNTDAGGSPRIVVADPLRKE
ncbi:MAG: glycosyltransferase family 2 protein [Acidobacteriota bacterium]|nr:glycosyltransferase family 2 protein [Acidobacteriota bacterium]